MLYYTTNYSPLRLLECGELYSTALTHSKYCNYRELLTMNNKVIRPECSYREMNERAGRSCRDGDLCSACWIDKDVEENKEMYQAMGDM